MRVDTCIGYVSLRRMRRAKEFRADVKHWCDQATAPGDLWAGDILYVFFVFLFSARVIVSWKCTLLSVFDRSYLVFVLKRESERRNKFNPQ